MPNSCSKFNVGGQAIIEGVMMRSPNSLAIAVRRPDGSIVVKEQRWESIWSRFKFLRWPFLRGTVMLVESLVNGIQALTFSADQAMVEESSDDKKEGAEDKKTPEKPMNRFMLYGTIAFSLAFTFLVFKGIPHLIATLAGTLTNTEIGTDSVVFHIIDGVVKMCMFVAYIWLISLMPDIKRVFQYHGAEHKSIYTYEKGEELTVENARRQTTLHPRCGTSFIILVLLVSIIVFMIIFPFIPTLYEGNRWINALLQVAIKLPLMLPIAGIAYELIRWSGKHPETPILKWFIKPGLWMQKITTREPSDDMLEIALISLRKALWREKHGLEGLDEKKDELEIYSDYASINFDKETPEKA